MTIKTIVKKKKHSQYFNRTTGYLTFNLEEKHCNGYNGYHFSQQKTLSIPVYD